ncbi:MAG: CDP-diacylglycerol--glycerol-3-phosphate 3-phosphatidyltransferase [Micropruina sp.]|nr:CDP-diacylglycerol--glycerol-3-phosphate 3-phosphatidyltransferase [Micropruina sp.]
MSGVEQEPSPFNLPNALTVIRLVLVPVFAWTLFVHPTDLLWRLAATAVFIVAIVTDAFDGHLARKYNLITRFGKIWDPIADKALTGMAFIGLSILGELPWWITLIILAREWGITWIRVAMLKYGVMVANKGGKLKTILQSIALILFLPGLPLLPVPLQWAAWTVMIAAFALTVMTGVDYVREAILLRRQGRSGGQ